jgi:FkbM family methyltransferase
MSNNLYDLVSRAPNYIKALGLVQGLKLLSRLEGMELLGFPGPSRVRLSTLIHPVDVRLIRADVSTFFQIFVNREYDFTQYPQGKRISEHYRSILSSGRRPLIVDVGANIGLASIFLASMYPEARVISVEPDVENFAILTGNASSYSSIRCVRGAVSDRSGKATLGNRKGGAAGYRLEEESGDGGVEVDIYTMDQIIEMGEGDEVLIVKMDVEGEEKSIFRCAESWLPRTHLLIVEIHDWMLPGSGSSRALFRALSNLPIEYVFRSQNLFAFNDIVSAQA